MSYFEHILCFENEDAALTALQSCHSEGVWDARHVTVVQMQTSMDEAGPEDPVTTARPIALAGHSLPGFWMIISLPEESAEIRALDECKLIASRKLLAEGSPFGFLTYLHWASAEFETVLRFFPKIAGVNYGAL